MLNARRNVRGARRRLGRFAGLAFDIVLILRAALPLIQALFTGLVPYRCADVRIPDVGRRIGGSIKFLLLELAASFFFLFGCGDSFCNFMQFCSLTFIILFTKSKVRNCQMKSLLRGLLID